MHWLWCRGKLCPLSLVLIWQWCDWLSMNHESIVNILEKAVRRFPRIGYREYVYLICKVRKLRFFEILATLYIEPRRQSKTEYRRVIRYTWWMIKNSKQKTNFAATIIIHLLSFICLFLQINGDKIIDVPGAEHSFDWYESVNRVIIEKLVHPPGSV